MGRYDTESRPNYLATDVTEPVFTSLTAHFALHRTCMARGKILEIHPVIPCARKDRRPFFITQS
jgi:hypothetical protein